MFVRSVVMSLNKSLRTYRGDHFAGQATDQPPPDLHVLYRVQD